MKSRTYLSCKTRILRVVCASVMLTGCSNMAQVAPTTDPTAGRMTPVVNQPQ